VAAARARRKTIFFISTSARENVRHKEMFHRSLA